MVLLESLELEYGKPIQDYSLTDTISTKTFTSKDLNKDIVVIAFICNHCPYVVRIIKDFSLLAQKTKDQVNWVAISANDPDYRQADSPENMKVFAKENNFSFPYLFDETQEVAKAFGAVCTPDIFVYKKDSSLRGAESDAAISQPYKLVYHARFEDLDKAIADLIEADKVSFESLPSAGCSIKWKD